jgi:CheY-like chemotaxis protein
MLSPLLSRVPQPKFAADKHVLYVEDDPRLHRSFQDNFESRFPPAEDKVALLKAFTLEEGLAALSGKPTPNLVITDGHLTGAMNAEGQQIIDEANQRRIPVALYSNNPDSFSGATTVFSKRTTTLDTIMSWIKTTLRLP